MPQTYERFSGEELKIAEKIKQRRYQMLVHSYIYYELDNNIVSDSTWSKWAVELAHLQNQYPDIAEQVEYAKDFVGWDGSSGAFLTYKDKPEITVIAHRLLRDTRNDTTPIKVKPVKVAPTKPKNQPLFAPTQSKPSTNKVATTKKKLF